MSDLPVPPPRLPFALPPGGRGGGFPGLPGRGGLGGGGIQGLKARPKPITFADKKIEEDDLEAQWKSGVLDRMRVLDQCRKPSPLPEECDLLHISDKRLDIHVLKEVLCLCGGNAGGRFSGDEFSTLLEMTKTLPKLWNAANLVFDALDKTQRKVSLSQHYMLLESEEAELLDLKICSKSESPTATIDSTCQQQTSSEQPECPESESELDAHASVIQYHRLADAYMRCVRRIQKLVKVKQEELKSCSSAALEGAAEGEDDEERGRPLPEWLQILHDKYELYGMPIVAYNLENTATPRVTNASAIKLKSFTVGKLAGYLSGMMVDTVPVEENEENALWWLLQASNDVHLVVSSDLSCAAVRQLAIRNGEQDTVDVVTDTASGDSDTSTSASTVIYNRQYWARRFYGFLSKTTELKSRPKDEKGLLLFSLHVAPCDGTVFAPSEKDLQIKAEREATAKDPWVGAKCV